MKKLERRELRLIDWEQKRFVRGNFRTFGLRGGLSANVTLMFPIINTIWNWKYRDWRLVIDDSISHLALVKSERMPESEKDNAAL